MRYIADAIASLPIRVYRDMGNGESQRIWSSALLGSPIAGGGPQVSGTLYDWLFAGSTSALLHGNAWGLVTNRSGIPGPDGNGLPTGISWLPPERVSVTDDEQQPENPLRAKIYYNGRLMDRTDLVHMPAFSVPGRVEGISPIRAFSMLWGQGLDALKYSAEWFQNGGFPPGTFQNVNEEVDEGQAKEIRRRLTDTIRLRQPLVFGRDWEYKEITVPPNEAAFIQAMQLNATQVAAIFGVQPHRVGGTRQDGLTYSNVTMNQLDEITSTLRPWLTRWEHLLTTLLPATQYAKFDVDDLLKMDPKNRTEVYAIQRNIGLRPVNEIRKENDWEPLEGGDEPLALQLLERMMQTTRSIPKSVMPLVILEADRIAKLLENMESEHPELVNPMTAGKPPLNTNGPQYLAKLVTQIRSGPLFGPPGAKAAESDRKSAVTMLEQHAKMGHLTPEEASVRVSRAQHAETTGQLADLFDDLPRMGDGVAPGVSRETFGPGEFRASDADRARARRLLAVHAKAGRLRSAELDARMRRAGEAVTCGDLATLFADLPAEKHAAPPPEEGQPSVPAPMFGPAALALLHRRALEFDQAGTPAAMNGKAH